MATNGEALHPTLSEMKDFGNGNHEHLEGSADSDLALKKMRTAGSISISPELFEKLYLSPKDSAATGNIIRKTIGTPTPIALVGFLLSLTPLSCDLMGWRGAGMANGSAGIPAYLFFGGVLMIVGGVLELLAGNTFPATVFASFGAFWLTYGGTLQDNVYHAQMNYQMNGAVPMEEAQAGFYNAFAFFLVWMGVLCFIYMLCSLRTNVVFFVIFFTLVLAFSCLAGAFWQLGQGNAVGMKLVIAGGACAFVTCVAGWYIFAAILLASLDFPIALPVGDLSSVVKGKKEAQD